MADEGDQTSLNSSLLVETSFNTDAITISSDNITSCSIDIEPSSETKSLDLENSTEITSRNKDIEQNSEMILLSTTDIDPTSEMISSSTNIDPTSDIIIDVSSTIEDNEIVTISSDGDSNIVEEAYEEGPHVEITSKFHLNAYHSSPSSSDFGDTDSSASPHMPTLCVGATDSDTEDDSESEGASDIDEFIEVVRDIRKRKAMVEKLPSAKFDTILANDIAFHPTQLELAISFDDRIELFVIECGEMIRTHRAHLTDSLAAVRYNSSGDSLFGISSKNLFRFQKGLGELMNTIRYHLFTETANTMMDVGQTSFAIASDEGTVFVVNQDSCELERLIKLDLEIEGMVVNCADIYVIAGNQVFKMGLHNTEVQNQNDANAYLTCGLVHGNSLVVGSAKGELVLFNRASLASQGTFRVSQKACITCMTTINDSAIAVAFDDGAIKLFSLFPNEEVGVIGMVATFATRMSRSYDGRWLVANDSLHDCKLFDLADIDDEVPLVSKKRKRGPSSHLTSSSTENKKDFFSSL